MDIFTKQTFPKNNEIYPDGAVIIEETIEDKKTPMRVLTHEENTAEIVAKRPKRAKAMPYDKDKN